VAGSAPDAVCATGADGSGVAAAAGAAGLAGGAASRSARGASVGAVVAPASRACEAFAAAGAFCAGAGGSAAVAAGAGVEDVGMVEGAGPGCATIGAFASAEASPLTAPDAGYDLEDLPVGAVSEYVLLSTGTLTIWPGLATVRGALARGVDAVGVADRSAAGVEGSAAGVDRPAGKGAARSSFGTEICGR